VPEMAGFDDCKRCGHALGYHNPLGCCCVGWQDTRPSEPKCYCWSPLVASSCYQTKCSVCNEPRQVDLRATHGSDGAVWVRQGWQRPCFTCIDWGLGA